MNYSIQIKAINDLKDVLQISKTQASKLLTSMKEAARESKDDRR